MNYQEKLSSMIKYKTVSIQGTNIDFKDFREHLKVLFPNLFKEEVIVLEGGLLIKWKGKTSDNPILFMNHHDVVDAEGDWLYPPFEGVITEDRVYGRGTIDTKGGLFMMLEAAEELIIDGFTPESDIYFESSNDEETNGKSALIIAEYLKKKNVHLRYVLDEGGMILDSPIGGDGIFSMIGVGEKGFCDLKFIAKSNGGHASMPPKNTPLVRLAKFMSDCEKTNLFKVELNETSKEMFKRYSKSSKGLFKLILGHPTLFKPLLKIVGPKLSPKLNALFRTTLCFTKASGSLSLNAIPDEAYVTGNMRFSHHQGKENSIKEVEKIANKYDIKIEVIDENEITPISSYKTAEFKLIEEAIIKNIGDLNPTPYILTGATDARNMSILTDNVYRFIPYYLSKEQVSSIHGLNEYINIESLYSGVNFYKYLMKNN